MTDEYFETEVGGETPLEVLFPPELAGESLISQVRETVRRGNDFLFSVQRPDSHWCAELESNVTITAQYVFLQQMLGIHRDEKIPALRAYLFSRQGAGGGWAIAEGLEEDLSASAEVYLALRILGVEADEPRLQRAQAFIRRGGGIEKVRVFTRIFFAMFGLMSWESVPSVPPEFIFVPPQSPVNIYSLSSWARGTMVPLFIIYHHRPVYALPNGQSTANNWLDALWLDPTNKKIAYQPPLPALVRRHGISWTSFFGVGDALVKAYERLGIPGLRRRALERCTKWVLDRQEASGDWAGIFPPMLNSVIALSLQGYGLDSEPVKKGLAAIEKFSWEDETGFRIQACVSPVWDTVLTAIALVDAGVQGSDPRLQRAMKWTKERQLNVDHGDWKVYRPDLRSGGWSFEYFNSWYPDVDDTAAVVLAFLKQDPLSRESETVVRAMEWMLGMQNKDGGWAAFDVDNDRLFLNRIPFSDMDSLCDPSSPDVTGRVLEAFGLWLRTASGPHFSMDEVNAPPTKSKGGKPGAASRLRANIERSIVKGVRYLRKTQEQQGSWFGRWGVNYIYGTSNVLCGLAQVGVTEHDAMVKRAVGWLEETQNPDGGWGEGLDSYADPARMGQGASAPSQTAWAVMGLLAYGAPSQPAVENGVRWLVDRQVDAIPMPAWEGGTPVPQAAGGTWDEATFTGTGFPNHFYLRYHYYRHYFPMMALGRYLAGLRN